jgi:demethylmenaquinone methyltransferase/2-methoxy-6-polyprenyl-1,4-benzoquinol methylase
MLEPISRVKRSKEKARDAYNRLSPWYDWISSDSKKECLEKGLQVLSAKAGDCVLEVGFGTGRGLVHLARTVGPAGRVFGVEISDGMVEAAKQRLAQASSSESVELAPVELHRCDASSSLPWEPETFDALFMSFTLELFDTPEIPLVLEQCRILLKPGVGRIAVVSLSKRPDSKAVRLYEWFHETFPAVVDCRPIYPQMHLAEAGFEVLEVTHVSVWGLPVEIVLAKKSME